MCLGDCIKKHVFKMTTFLFMILFVIMVILYVKEKNVSVSKWHGDMTGLMENGLKRDLLYSQKIVVRPFYLAKMKNYESIYPSRGLGGASWGGNYIFATKSHSYRLERKMINKN